MNNMMIKSITVLFIAVALMAGCTGSGNKPLSTDVVNNSKSAVAHADSGMPASIFFTTTMHDFGNVIQGEQVTYNFKFINAGGSDLLISTVSTSCGCTVGKFPKEPIKPGEHGFIEVKFDTRRRKGTQRKTATVVSNSEPNKTTLRIQAQVVLPEEN